VGIVVDQNVQAKDGIFVRFFGRPASTTTVAAALALKTGSPIVPARCVLRGDGRYRMVYGPPVAWSSSGRRHEDIARLTQDIATVIEGWVREAPEQWLWLHRRWKTQPSPSRETPAQAGLPGSAVSRPAAAEPSSESPPKAPPKALPKVLPKAPHWVRPREKLRDRPRAPPRPHPELDRRRRALPPRAARPAAVLPTARLEVLARPWVGELYRAVPEVDAVVESRGHAADFLALRGRYDLGVLLPNSFGTALVLWRAGISERWAMRRTAAASS